MRRVMLAGLLKIELPGHTVLLTDGGTVPYDGDSYRGRDPLFGVLADPDEIEEGATEELPSLTLRFIPPAGVASLDLNDPAFQDCRLRMFLAELDEDGAPILVEQIADMLIDVPQLVFPEESGRELEVICVSVWQRLFDTNEGNLLNSASHQKVHPGEQGLDNTTGVDRNVPWGTNSVRTGN